MSTDVPLRCACGAVRGIARGVDPATGSRLACMCDDCQTYAHYLGKPERILDEWGGTDVFQMTPSQLEITDGLGHVRCVRQSPKGLMRWYAGCCNTPIGNTARSPRVPFVGVLHPFMDHEADGRSRDEVLGPLRARTQGRWGRGELPPDAHPRAPLGLILHSIRVFLLAWIRRQHARSPFFDPTSGALIVEPTVLTPEERNALRKHVTRRP